jgi:lipoate-protein ligase B
MNLEFLSLGLQDYPSVLAQQLELRERRQRGLISDTILTVEHPPVITEGRRPAAGDYHVAREVLQRQGIATAKVNRGGRLTYHGPGQLVAYYIISLKDRGLRVPDFVRAVEETALRTLSSFGVGAARRKGCPGVWVDDRKIVSIGLAVDRGVSMHGMALNIQPDFSHFQLIVPCGMPDCEMTSLEKETGRVEDFSKVEKRFIQAAREVFGKEI